MLTTRKYDLITISREYGAGASELAARVGAELGWPVLDGDIVNRVAQRLGLPRDQLAQWDEHAPTFIESLGTALMIGTAELAVPVDATIVPDAKLVATTTRHVLEEAAQHLPLIIVGHGAQAIFSRRPRTLRVRLVAPLAWRVENIMRRTGVNAKDAASLAAHFDRDRAHYVKEFEGRNVNDPYLHGLQINTAEIPLADAVRLVYHQVFEVPAVPA